MTATATAAITLGPGGTTTAPLGVGTWPWGEQRFWGYGQEYGHEEVAAAFAASVAAGVTFFDTDEIYGQGESERILGALPKKSTMPIIIATKYAPLPWRLRARSVRQALNASMDRMGMTSVDLYQIHFPYSLLSIETLMDALTRRGVPLATNQIRYNLLARKAETDGTLAACRALGVTVLAYSPLAQGLLTGKYPTGDVTPAGIRRWQPAFRPQRLRRLTGLLDLIRGIGEDHGGKTPAQVALNWLIQQAGALPIPGAKTAAQSISNPGALGWALQPAEVDALAMASRR